MLLFYEAVLPKRESRVWRSSVPPEHRDEPGDLRFAEKADPNRPKPISFCDHAGCGCSACCQRVLWYLQSTPTQSLIQLSLNHLQWELQMPGCYWVLVSRLGSANHYMLQGLTPNDGEPAAPAAISLLALGPELGAHLHDGRQGRLD